MKKSNIMSASALFLGIALAVATSAFTTKSNNANRANTYWRFDGTQLSDSRMSGQYVKISVNDIPDCDESQIIPCVLQVDESIDTPTELQTYLNTYSNDQDVVDNAYSTKAE